MTLKIDLQKCTGCGICDRVCPLDVIHMDKEKKIPVEKYGDECWYCGVCKMECPEGAIEIELHPSISLL